MNKFYVYFLIDPRTNQPFYIGKGTGNRAWSHLSGNKGTRNKIKEDKIKSIRKNGFEPKVEIYKDALLENDAYDLERDLIVKYGRIIDNSGILTNICEDNRPPVRNKPHSENTKRLISIAAKGKKFTKEHKKKLSEAAKISSQRLCSESKRKKLSVAQKGKPREYLHKQIVCIETNEIFQKVKDFRNYLKLVGDSEFLFNKQIKQFGMFKSKSGKTYRYLNKQYKKQNRNDK